MWEKVVISFTHLVKTTRWLPSERLPGVSGCVETAKNADEANNGWRQETLDHVGRHFVDLGDDDAREAGDDQDSDQREHANTDDSDALLTDETRVEFAEFEIRLSRLHQDNVLKLFRVGQLRRSFYQHVERGVALRCSSSDDRGLPVRGLGGLPRLVWPSEHEAVKNGQTRPGS